MSREVVSWVKLEQHLTSTEPYTVNSTIVPTTKFLCSFCELKEIKKNKNKPKESKKMSGRWSYHLIGQQLVESGLSTPSSTITSSLMLTRDINGTSVFGLKSEFGSQNKLERHQHRHVRLMVPLSRQLIFFKCQSVNRDEKK